MIPYDSVVTAERRVVRSGFHLHLSQGSRFSVRVRRGRLRKFENQLRNRGVVIVDEYGARVDQSQFEKEADPHFVRRSIDEYDAGCATMV